MGQEEAKREYIERVESLAPGRIAEAQSFESPRRRVAGSAPSPLDRAPLWHCGHLFKQRDLLKGWRKRYFVLEGAELKYYLSSMDINPRGRLPLKVRRLWPPSAARRGASYTFGRFIARLGLCRRFRWGKPAIGRRRLLRLRARAGRSVRPAPPRHRHSYTVLRVFASA